MADRLRYSIADRLIHIHLEGDYTIERLLELVQSALDDPAAPSRALLLVDARKSTVQRSSKEVRTIAAFGSALAHRIERSAILTSQDLHYGLARMAAMLVEDSGLLMSPFRDVTAAYRFLGLPRPRTG